MRIAYLEDSLEDQFLFKGLCQELGYEVTLLNTNMAFNSFPKPC